ncbi:hypothetical protein V6Z12_A04G173500 [Gossypium hirsutum]
MAIWVFLKNYGYAVNNRLIINFVYRRRDLKRWSLFSLVMFSEGSIICGAGVLEGNKGSMYGTKVVLPLLPPALILSGKEEQIGSHIILGFIVAYTYVVLFLPNTIYGGKAETKTRSSAV